MVKGRGVEGGSRTRQVYKEATMVDGPKGCAQGGSRIGRDAKSRRPGANPPRGRVSAEAAVERSGSASDEGLLREATKSSEPRLKLSGSW